MNSTRAQLLDEATEWHLRLQGEEVSDDTITRWVQWCESDPKKQRAFDEVREFWGLTGGLEPVVRNGEFIDATHQRNSTRKTWISLWPAAAFVGVTAAVAATAWVGWGPLGQILGGDHKLLIAQNEVYETRLSDGSHVQLAAKSVVAINYTDRGRSLELKNGEAFFTVAPNKERPFVVTIGGVRVRALGTAFNVRRAGSRTVVTVTQGLVEVTRAGAGQGAATQARAGEQITWVDREAQPLRTSRSANETLAWRDGRLEYVAEPLEAVIADLNRYAQRPAVVADDVAKALRFSGTVLTDATGEWIAALPGILPLTVQNENGVDVIRSAQ